MRQGVEVTGLDAARHQEVARALRRGLEEAGRLDLHEGALVQRLADGEGEVGAQLEVGHHVRAANVQVAVAQAHVLASLDVVLDLEGRGLGAVEHGDGAHQHLHVAGDELGVLHALGALAHGARHLDGPLGADTLSRMKGLAAGMLGVEGDLRDTLAIAQVHEDEAAVVAAAPHPAGERDLLADVLAAKLAAGMRVHGVGLGHVRSSLGPCRPVSVRAAGVQTARMRRQRRRASVHDSAAAANSPQQCGRLRSRNKWPPARGAVGGYGASGAYS